MSDFAPDATASGAEHRWWLLVRCLDAGLDPREAIDTARDMEHFVTGGIDPNQKALPPPRPEPAPEPEPDSAPVSPAPPPKGPGRSSTIWNDKNTARLKELHATDMRVKEIAVVLGLTPQQVYNKISGLRLNKQPEQPKPAAPDDDAPAMEEAEPEDEFDDSVDTDTIAASVTTIITFIRSRDIVVIPQGRNVWSVEGRGDLNKDELLAYANKVKRWIKEPEFHYGL